MRAPSRCRACLCPCTSERALSAAAADALLLDALTAVVCDDCYDRACPRPAPRAVQIGTVACDLADRYPVAVSL